MLHIDIPDILQVGNVVKINLRQQVIFDHPLDHIIRRAYDIVGDGTGLNLRIHDLVRLILLVDNIDAGLFLKHLNSLRVDIFAPVVDDHLIIAA